MLPRCPRKVLDVLFGRFWMPQVLPRTYFWLISLSILDALGVAACHNKVSTEGFATAALPQQGFYGRLCYSMLATTRFP